MGLKAGARTATLIAERDEDVDLLKAWEQDPFRIYDFTGEQKTIKEVTTGDSVLSLNPPYAVVDTGHGTDLITCHGEEVPGGFSRPGVINTQTFRHPIEVSAWMRVRNRQNTTATQYAGIGIGYPNQGQTYPFLTTFDQLCCQLRLVASTLAWELVIGGFSIPTTIVALEGTEAAALGVGQNARLVWNPDQPSLRAYINGVLGAEITDTDLLPADLENEQIANTGPNWFVTSGSHANGYLTLDIGPWFVRTFGVKDES